jgi:Fur family transcriptional regulator, peroxide stress response regulator
MHPTATEIYDSVRKQLPRISLGTVYRNLDFLAEQGIIRKLEIGGAKARFDECGEHHHVLCVQCGKIDDIHDTPGDLLNEEITELNGYKIIGFRLEFFGLCPECKKKLV